MTLIVNPKELRKVQKLCFCYACGQTFAQGDKLNRDHVPPTSCFSLHDKFQPLILPTHVACNSAYSFADERVGQFISLKHGRVPPQKSRRLTFRSFRDPRTGQVFGAVDNVDVRGAIQRWIKAFHAALYREPLPANTGFGIETPFAVGVPTKDGVVLDTGRPQHLLFVEIIKTNRLSRNIDRIACNNGKLQYECVWSQTQNDDWVCVFALDIYEWKELGKLGHDSAKGCVGFYKLPSGTLPDAATKACKLDLVLPNFQPLDPFGQ